jgi:hypothetical protein
MMFVRRKRRRRMKIGMVGKLMNIMKMIGKRKRKKMMMMMLLLLLLLLLLFDEEYVVIVMLVMLMIILIRSFDKIQNVVIVEE